MTPIEQIIIRWILAINAGLTGVVGAFELLDSIDRTIMVVVILVSAFLSAVAAFFTTEQGRTTARSMTNASKNG